MAKKEKTPSGPTGYRVVASNRRAAYKFHLDETFEGGIALLGTEVKSLRMGQVSIAEAFGRVRGGEVWLVNIDIPAYEHSGYSKHEPKRARKILLHAREIRKVAEALEQKGHTLVPLSLYFNDRGIAKIKIALARGKGKADRREDVRKREHVREVDAEMARRARSKRNS